MVIKMKMPISMMVYIIKKLIEDRMYFSIASSSMDLRFKFTPLSESNDWAVEIELGAIDCVGRLSYAFYDRLDVDISKAFDYTDSEPGYDAISFIMDFKNHPEDFQTILIRDKNPDLDFWA